MSLPSEFREFTLRFHQDLMEDVTTEEEIIIFVLSPFKNNTERARLRDYLESIIRDDVTDEQLRKSWWSSSADVVFHDGAEL